MAKKRLTKAEREQQKADAQMALLKKITEEAHEAARRGETEPPIR